MRELKFRAWFEDKGEMNNVAMNNVYKGNTSYMHLSPMPFSNYRLIELMQYTGLKDKNGCEVYEGDILKRVVTIVLYGSGHPPEDVEDVAVVVWREDYAGFYIGERPLFAEIDATSDFFTGCGCTKFEVIGNIHENPELLGDSK